MAKQRGVVKLHGTLDDITFNKTRDGYLAKTTSRISKSRMASDPAFERTRENMAEFSRAGSAARLLRVAFQSKAKAIGDRRIVSRLVKEMVKVVKADQTNDRGQRNVLDGEMELLQGFEFNERSSLVSSFAAPYSSSIDRASGECTVTIPSFVPANMITPPQGATHCILFAAAAEIDFESKTFVVEVKQQAALALDNNATSAITMTNALAAHSAHPLFAVLGIEFVEQVNGKYYALKNGAFNAMAIVKVSGV